MSEKKSNLSNYNWKDRIPNHISINDLSERQQFLLMESKTFCMLPWLHLHAWPDGNAYPCCLGNARYPVGNLKEKTMAETWNDRPMREMRINMLHEQPCNECSDCYEQEKHGFSSMRTNSNKDFGHLISEVDDTSEDGHLEKFVMRYWDVRFSNVCNLRCRSCGSIFSNKWAEDDFKLHGKYLRPKIQHAGRDKNDIWEQMQPHIPYIEQIYFAGGEPLIMEEHNKILKLLIETGNTGVRLVYNTNLTELNFKRQNVLDLWKHFPSVCVAASLDDMGERAEIIRKETKWEKVEQNIRDLKRECPHIDFMLSPTLSIMNVWNLVRFHRYMIDQGFIQPKDFNVNILQGPQEYRIDMLPGDIKQQIKKEFEEHIKWLQDRDPISRATGGFEGAIQFMMAEDHVDWLPDFWDTVDDIDRIRNEKLVDIIPELKQIEKYRREITT